MYTEKKVSIAALYLDPNNPRLAVKTEISDAVPDDEIASRQNDLQDRFTDGPSTGNSENNEGGTDISDLLDSISKMGYQGIDQIVVRPINRAGTKYVVIEGNRRVASIKRLIEQDSSGTIDSDRGENGHLEGDVLETLKKIDLLVLDTEGISQEDIQRRINIILGLRHHGSLLPWEPLPRAFNIFSEYMHELSIFREQVIPCEFSKFEKESAVINNVAKRLTIKKREVSSFLQAYIVYCQLRKVGHNVKGKHFSLVMELVINRSLETHYLPKSSNFFLKEEGLERLNTVGEFDDRDNSGFTKILDDTKSVKKLKNLVLTQFDHSYSESVRGLARSLLVAVEEKEKSLEEALEEVINAKHREKWVQALEGELDKLIRDKNPLRYDQYPGFGNDRAAKDTLRKTVKRLQLLVDVDESP